jgi:hypothetical protein
VVGVEKLFGGPAIPAPGRRINLHLHRAILLRLACYHR